MNVTWQHFDQSVKRLAVGHTTIFHVAAFVGKPSFADVVKSPARSVVRPLMSRQNLLNQQTMTSSSRYVCFSVPKLPGKSGNFSSELLLLLLLRPFNGLFSWTTWVSHYEGKTSLDLNTATDDGVWGCSDHM